MLRLALITLVAAGSICSAVGQETAGKVKTDPSEQAQKAGGLPVGKPGPGMVWVDAQKKIYYRQGDRMYGKTKKGAYMSEGDALNSGFVDKSANPIKSQPAQRKSE